MDLSYADYQVIKKSMAMAEGALQSVLRVISDGDLRTPDALSIEGVTTVLDELKGGAALFDGRFSGR